MSKIIGNCLVIASLLSPPAHAGWVKDWCDALLSELATDDPWPYAREPTAVLLSVLERTHDRIASPVLHELIYRYRRGWNMTDKQREQFLEIMR